MFGMSSDVAIKIMWDLYNIVFFHEWQNSKAYGLLFTLENINSIGV